MLKCAADISCHITTGEKMTIKPRMQTAINKQINAELYSAYIYFSMSSYFNNLNLSGFANWMQKQAKEEVQHALKFYNFIYERGGKVTLLAIAQPPKTFKSPLAAFQQAFRHEQQVTKLIHKLADIADSLKDRATLSFLDWFIDEQVEEEDSANQIVEQLKMIGSSKNGLLMLDQQLGKRK